MTRFEFMEIAGYTVSVETYEKFIEPAYMISKLNKKEFVESLNREAVEFNPFKRIKRLAAEAYEKCGSECIDWYTEEIFKEIKELQRSTNKKYILIQDKKNDCYYPSVLREYWFDNEFIKNIMLVIA